MSMNNRTRESSRGDVSASHNYCGDRNWIAECLCPTVARTRLLLPRPRDARVRVSCDTGCLSSLYSTVPCRGDVAGWPLCGLRTVDA